VQLHHGAISAENASPGLRVRIAIPLAVQAKPALAEVDAVSRS
jgi:hypothetical protein